MKLYAVRVFVRDFDAAVAFYTETLGLRALFCDPQMGWCELDTGEAHLALERVVPEQAPYEAVAEDEPDLVGRFVGVSLRVDDIHKLCERLRAKGVEFPGPPERQPWGGVLAHLSDPEGNVLTLLGS